MTLTSEYQYIGRSNAVGNQGGSYSYYILLYAKTSGSTSTGKHTVTVKQRIACNAQASFYGYSTSGGISIAGSGAVSWSWLNVPGSAWSSGLTEGGVTYPLWTDLREGSVTIDVGYGATKDILIEASWVLNDDRAISYLPKRDVTAAVSAAVTLPMIAGASKPSVSASSVDLGNSVTVYTNRIAGSGFTHKLTYQFGDASGTIAEGAADSAVWSPSLDLAYQIPNAVSGTAVITCTTYSGGVRIGSPQQVTVLLTVPQSVVPTASATWSDASGAREMMGVFVQNVTRLSVDVAGTGAYGSTVTGASVTLNGKSYSGGTVTEAGELALAVSVTDSRGRTGTASYTLSVAAYSAPALTLNASRCTAAGVADDTGDYAKITVSGHVTQVGGSNRAVLVLSWGSSSETVELSVGDCSYEKLVYADPNTTMDISALLSDRLIETQRSMTLSTGYATLDLLAGGKGIAFGKAATREGFDCAMPAYFSGPVEGVLQAIESTDYPGCFYRTVGGQTEWINPPIATGMECRTMERWAGYPVYVKHIAFGTLPNASQGRLGIGISSHQLIRGTAILNGPSFKEPFPSCSYNEDAPAYWWIDTGGALYIKTNANCSSCTANFTLWYIKT